ncbi:MAG: GMC family oxidoreductase [Paracoccaceae bacterium]
MSGSFDAVVVGAGAGGAAAAWRLCHKGLKVLLLEAGPRFVPERDYPLDTPGWERHLFPDKPGSQAKISYGDLGDLDPENEDLASWNVVAGRLAKGRKRMPEPGYSHVQGIGGSTLHFVGEAHRMHPDAFRLRARLGAAADWPLSYDDLEPYYAECEDLTGVAGPGAQGARWRSGPFPLPPHPLNTAARRLVEAGKRLGTEWQANSRFALSQPYDGRPACNYCGNCSRGCPLGDKGSCDVTFIRHAEATGKLTIETKAVVTRIISGKTGRIEAVDYIRGGKQRRQPTPTLILSAGAVQTPRLLLASANAEAPDGLANGSGQVGRNFMETVAWTSTGIAPGLRMSHAGLPADAICWTFNAPDSVPGAVGGCRFNSHVQETGLVGPIAYGSRLIDGFGADFKARMRREFGAAISVGGIAEVVPDHRSRVDLDPRQSDAHGMRLPRISSVLTENSLTLLRFMAEHARATLAEAGVEDLREEISSRDRFAATHVFGTCRMGHDSGESVVDANGRSHDHENLYIADASIFPSSGGGEAPALTIEALALRMADRIAF